MLWPLVLPFTITFWLLIAVVAMATAIAPLLKWKCVKVFFIATSLALIAFIPSCAGIMHLADKLRFGYFEFATFDDVKDFRAERYLPKAASKIKMYKQANGYQAQYRISSADFHAYLDSLWTEYGQYSAVKRGEMMDQGMAASHEEMDRVFADIGWKPLSGAVVYYSTRELDGGGATYYFDANAGVAYQRTGYW
jgi:hypothetical protein